MPEGWQPLKAKPSWQPTADSELSALSAIGSLETPADDEHSLDEHFEHWE